MCSTCCIARPYSEVEKARSWFNRSVTLNPDIGDHWAMFYKFEMQHGTEEHQQAVLKRCVEVDPKHGELWCRVLKSVQNWHDTTAQVLKKTVLELDKST